MYLTRIAGIEPDHHKRRLRDDWMYLTRIAGIEPQTGTDNYTKAMDVSYPHSGN